MAQKKTSKKLPVPLSDFIDFWRWPKRKNDVEFDNGEYAAGVDHEDDPAMGVLFLSEAQRAMLAGALYRISRRWPMDAPFIKMQEAQYLYDGALQLMALKPFVIDFRRKPGTALDTFHLQAKILNGEWFDTQYAPTIFMENTFFGPPTDENDTGIGSWDYIALDQLPNGVRPFRWQLKLNRAQFQGTIITDAVGIGLSSISAAYAQLVNHPTVTGTKRLQVGIPAGTPGTDGDDGTIITDATASALSSISAPFAQLVNHPTVTGTKRLQLGIPAGATGAQGEDGEDGEIGHGIELTDPPVQVLNPNQNPSILEDNALPSKTFVKFKLPRARNFSLLPTLTGNPGTDAAVGIADDTNGDKVLQFTIPRGIPGASAQYAFDDQPPAEGQIKHYSMHVDAAGTIIPFYLQNGWKVKNITAKGLWATRDNVNTVEEIHDLNGAVFSGNTYGGLLIGLKTPADNYFNYESYPGEHEILFDATAVAFRQETYSQFVTGYGYLWVDFDVERQAANAIIGTHDFEIDNRGWHAVTQSEASGIGFGNEWGGAWVADGVIGNGFRPTTNPAEGYNATIMSPVAGAAFTLTGLQFYYDNMPNSGILYAWAYKDGSGWHFLGNNHINAGGAGAPSTTGLNIPNVVQVALVTTSYQHAPTSDWRIRKAVITGT